MKIYLLIALLFTAPQAIAMCKFSCCGQQLKKQKITTENPNIQAVKGKNQNKKNLLDLIKKSDLAGVRSFTQTDGVSCIDEEVIDAAKNRFDKNIHNPHQATDKKFFTSNEFCIMILVQASAPNEIKEKLGLPT